MINYAIHHSNTGYIPIRAHTSHMLHTSVCCYFSPSFFLFSFFLPNDFWALYTAAKRHQFIFTLLFFCHRSDDYAMEIKNNLLYTQHTYPNIAIYMVEWDRPYRILAQTMYTNITMLIHSIEHRQWLHRAQDLLPLRFDWSGQCSSDKWYSCMAHDGFDRISQWSANKYRALDFYLLQNAQWCTNNGRRKQINGEKKEGIDNEKWLLITIHLECRI